MRRQRLPAWPFLLYAGVLLFIFFNRGSQHPPRIYEYDKGGYYSYLPSFFIYKDVAQQRGYLAAVARLRLSNEQFAGGTHLHPQTGRRVIKYSLGLALAEAPAFLIAHILASPLGFPPDGFSPPYAVAIGVTGIVFATLGLWWLSKLLQRGFSQRTVWLTLAAIALGTNLYTYTAFEPGMSHPVSFGLVSGALFFADRWYRTKRLRDALLIAALLGWIALVRPLNILIALPVLFWNAGTADALRERLQFWRMTAHQLLPAVLVFFLMLLPQLLYWKYVSGSWVYYSYGEEGFDWTKPQIWKGLASYKRGWLVYSPVMALALAGFAWMAIAKKEDCCCPSFWAWQRWCMQCFAGGNGITALALAHARSLTCCR